MGQFVHVNVAIWTGLTPLLNYLADGSATLSPGARAAPTSMRGLTLDEAFLDPIDLPMDQELDLHFALGSGSRCDGQQQRSQLPQQGGAAAQAAYSQQFPSTAPARGHLLPPPPCAKQICAEPQQILQSSAPIPTQHREHFVQRIASPFSASSGYSPSEASGALHQTQRWAVAPLRSSHSSGALQQSSSSPSDGGHADKTRGADPGKRRSSEDAGSRPSSGRQSRTRLSQSKAGAKPKVSPWPVRRFETFVCTAGAFITQLYECRRCHAAACLVSDTFQSSSAASAGPEQDR